MTDSRYRTVLLFGAPGAGKGTQGAILGTIPGFFHLSCGDVFRSLDLESELGRVFTEYSSKGELVPDDFTVELWRRNMRGRTQHGGFRPESDILVLDGIPRNVRQAELLEADIDVLQVVHLGCEDQQEMIARLRRRALKENRADDAREQVILNRWEVYRTESAPVIGHYPSDRVASVDASQTPAEVLRDVLAIVIPVQQRVRS